MPETPTPGQLAYEAYWQTWNDGRPPLLVWAQLVPDNRAAWEAAAQAVRDRVMQDVIAGGAQAREERQARQQDAP